MIPNGDQGLGDVNEHSSESNRRVALTESANGSRDDSEDPGPHRMNGINGHTMLETPVSAIPGRLTGVGSDYVLGTAVFESPIADAADTESCAIQDHLSQDDLADSAINGVGSVRVGELPRSSDIESASETEDLSQSEQLSAQGAPSELPPHPAAGSHFTPYLVTEIRELRNRRPRRGFWRRLFG
jgi:hypothetical protein